MKLYFYTRSWDGKQPAIVHVTTSAAGEFEFANIGEGHYRLEISSDDLRDDERTGKVPANKSIVIDISPIFPDTGEHEFEAKEKNETALRSVAGNSIVL
jgi:hypothetical protein